MVWALFGDGLAVDFEGEGYGFEEDGGVAPGEEFGAGVVILHSAVLCASNGGNQYFPGIGNPFLFFEAGYEDYGKWVVGFEGHIAKGMGLFFGEAY